MEELLKFKKKIEKKKKKIDYITNTECKDLDIGEKRYSFMDNDIYLKTYDNNKVNETCAIVKEKFGKEKDLIDSIINTIILGEKRIQSLIVGPRCLSQIDLFNKEKCANWVETVIKPDKLYNEEWHKLFNKFVTNYSEVFTFLDNNIHNMNEIDIRIKLFNLEKESRKLYRDILNIEIHTNETYEEFQKALKRNKLRKLAKLNVLRMNVGLAPEL